MTRTELHSPRALSAPRSSPPRFSAFRHSQISSYPATLALIFEFAVDVSRMR